MFLHAYGLAPSNVRRHQVLLLVLGVHTQMRAVLGRRDRAPAPDAALLNRFQVHACVARDPVLRRNQARARWGVAACRVERADLESTLTRFCISFGAQRCRAAATAFTAGFACAKDAERIPRLREADEDQRARQHER